MIDLIKSLKALVQNTLLTRSGTVVDQEIKLRDTNCNFVIFRNLIISRIPRCVKTTDLEVRENRGV